MSILGACDHVFLELTTIGLTPVDDHPHYVCMLCGARYDIVRGEHHGPELALESTQQQGVTKWIRKAAV